MVGGKWMNRIKLIMNGEGDHNLTYMRHKRFICCPKHTIYDFHILLYYHGPLRFKRNYCIIVLTIMKRMKLYCESKVTFGAIAHTSSAYEATTVFFS